MSVRRVRAITFAASLLAFLVVPLVDATTAVAACSAPTSVLHSGSRGSCVLALQRRLAALHYDLGTPDGVYGGQTYHAVVAFQKVNGLRRTGSVTLSTWNRLFRNPSLAHLRYIRSGSGLEVNLSKQVMLRASGGRLVRIYDVSTGRPSLPTPTSGSRPFHIWRKAMWGSTGYNDREQYVQYFYRGSLLAMHAYSYVPAYPTSHGCIRLIPSSAARLWAATYVGERVYTYS
jgi:peptidoglycan hydrolase-like protein with peptidoglycan-binding domain